MNLSVNIIGLTILLSTLCSISLAEGIGELFPRVNTLLGTIEGYYKTSSNGRQFEAYEGIRYAKPPTETSRFEVVETISSWTGVLMAKQFGAPCMQYIALEVKGSEDCLYLNIYTPVVNQTLIDSSLPVVFFIHGGAFVTGTGMEYGPKYLMNKDVVLVTFNYRLGPLGFLSTEDEIVPGNMGLKDQVIALRWVKENIESFGGDPSRITISGQSAGGASVHYHYLTNLTEGLFHGGISLSGTALNCWAQIENPLQQAKKLGMLVGCPTVNVQNMVTCLKDRPAHQIVGALAEFSTWPGAILQFGPVIENAASESTFINRPPIEIIASGKAHDLPWIAGTTSAEGIILTFPVLVNDSLFIELNDKWQTIAPNYLNFESTIDRSEYATVARLMKQDYLGTSSFSRATFGQMVQMLSDRYIIDDTIKAVKLQAGANQSPVWYYHISYRGAHSLSETLIGSDENFGVCHGDDLSYVLESYFDPTTTPEDLDMQETLLNIWVSFATGGAPISVGINWPGVRGLSAKNRYLHISGPQEILTMDLESINSATEKAWRSIKFQENVY